MTLAAVCTAVTVILSQISVPLPTGVPMTLQTFAVVLCGALLGARWGSASIAVYLALGAVGLPVFTGFHGGIGSLFGVTGGFLWGFLAMAGLCGLAVQRRSGWLRAALCAVGLAVCHLCGVLQYSVVTGTPVLRAAWMISAPFLVKDAASVGAAVLFAMLRHRRIPRLSM